MEKSVSHYTSNSAAFAILLAPERKIQEKTLSEINSLISSAGFVPNLQIKDSGYNIVVNKALQNKEGLLDIRFSSIRKLNDTSEFSHGKALLEKVIRLINPKNKEIANWIDFVIGAISDESILRAIEENTYIFSLSSLANDLNQWRLYADDGRGVSFEFDYFELKQIYQTNFYSAVSEVKYQEDEISNYLDMFFTTQFEPHQEYKLITQLDTLKHLDASELGKALVLFKVVNIMLSLKNKAFNPEKEIRIVYNPVFINYAVNYGKQHRDILLSYLKGFSDSIKQFDISNDQIYSYKIMPIPRRCLKRLWLGPKNPNSEDIYRNYLAYNGYENIEVKKSTLPYR